HDDPVARGAVGDEVDPDVAVGTTKDVDRRRAVVDVAEAIDVALLGVAVELLDPLARDLRGSDLDRTDAGEQRFDVLAQLELRPGLVPGLADPRLVAAALDPL